MSLQPIFGVIESNLTVPSTSSFSTRPARKLSTRGIGKGGRGGGGGGGGQGGGIWQILKFFGQIP